MPKYMVVLERITEEEIMIEADSDVEAIDKVLDGEGELTLFDEWAPNITHTIEIDDEWVPEITAPIVEVEDDE